MKFTWKSILIIIVVFLAISTVFFYFTVSMSSPVVMNIYMPEDNEKVNIKENYPSTLTLLLLQGDKVYTYFGANVSNGRTVDLKDTRSVIIEGIQRFSKDSLAVLIKPSEKATYQNTVDILDEMAINDIKKYKMVDLNKEEQGLISKN